MRPEKHRKRDKGDPTRLHCAQVVSQPAKTNDRRLVAMGAKAEQTRVLRSPWLIALKIIEICSLLLSNGHPIIMNRDPSFLFVGIRPTLFTVSHERPIPLKRLKLTPASTKKRMEEFVFPGLSALSPQDRTKVRDIFICISKKDYWAATLQYNSWTNTK